SFAKRKPALSIAVLPFADMSPEKDQEYFCDGMAEELINTLTRVEGLRVTSRTSAFQFKGQAQDIRDIAEQLNVATVLEGSVRKSGDKLRITAQLVKASEGFQLWSERFERDVKDVFAVQDEISEAIVNTLKSKLVDAARVTALRRYTENLEAYNLYLQGRYYWAKRTEEDLNKGIEFFNQAIDIDPDYALAYSGLADSHIMLGTYGALAPKKTMPKAEKAALNALRIDESLAEAHASLGCFRAIYNWDWSTAEQDFRRAIELNPSYATAHHWYAINCLVPQKRFDEAFAHMKRARDLDPLSHFINASMGLLHYFSGQYDLAIENYQKTIDMEPNFGVAHFFQGQAYLKQAKYREAITAFVEAIALHGDSTNMLANLTNAYAVMGKNDGARKRLSQLLDMAKDRYVSEYDVAIIHASFGEHDKAFEWLEMARSERSYLLIYLNVDPMMQNLRPDPRFAGQLEQIGLS
ncbi:MAG: tetratricopeptide repeat protein, partial [bacterium]